MRYFFGLSDLSVMSLCRKCEPGLSYVPSGVGPGACVAAEIPGLYIGMHPKNINGFFFSS